MGSGKVWFFIGRFVRLKFLNCLLLFMFVCTSANAEVIFDWASVGNPGNAPDTRYDPNGFGSVHYEYRISKHEVTNKQYVEFLNAVASSDANGLYNIKMGSDSRGGIIRDGSSGSFTYSVKSPSLGQGPGESDYSYENKPVNFISFIDAMRFINWLNNGQGTGSTETGTYEIKDGVSETRSILAKYWIPSEDEWYKAAYYDPYANGIYYEYPTATNIFPDNNLPSEDSGNSANFQNLGFTTEDPNHPFTDVGAYELSRSPYGTFDQGGNVSEFNEAIQFSRFRGLRGGSATDFDDFFLDAGDRNIYRPTSEDSNVGFRVASIAVPEPSSMILFSFAFGLLGFIRR